MTTINAATLAANYLTIEQGKGAIKGSIENVWTQLVEFASPSIIGNNAEAVGAYLAQTVEVEIRKQMGGKGSMPGSYRSAKSVVCKAVLKNVPLFNADGTVRGKTAVEKDCKEEKSAEQRIEDMLAKVRDLMADGAVLTPTAVALLADITK